MGNKSVGIIDLGLDINSNYFNKQLKGISKGAEKSVKGAFSGMGKMIGAAIGVAAITSFTKSCLELGSNLTEVQNVVDTVFPSMNGQVNEFASNAMTQFGLSETVAKKYMGTLGAMSKSMGMTESTSYEMSSAIAGLAGDVASFYNMSSDEAYTKLKSIWTGETESLKELGVVMTQANLDQYAMKMGYQQTTSTMTEQMKLMLRYQYVTSTLASAQGDFAKTSDSWANQVRVLGLRFDSLRATLGQGLINVFSPILKSLNGLIAKLQTAADAFKSFTDSIFGTSSSSSSNSAVSGLVEDTDALTSSTEEAAKAQNALMGFDKITKIGDSASSDASGVSSAGSPSSVTVTPQVAEPDTSGAEKAITKLMAFLEPLRKINFNPLMVAFGNLGNSASILADTLWDALGWAYTNILVPLATWTIQDFLPAFLDATAGALDVFNSTLEALQPLWQWAWDSFLQPIAAWTGGVIVSILDGITTSLEGVSGWIDNNQGTVQTMAVTVGVFAAAWKGIELAEFLVNVGGIPGLLNKVTVALKACTVAKIADKLETLKICSLYAKDFVVSMASSTKALIINSAQWVLSKVSLVASTAATVASTVATTACAAATWVLNGALMVLTSPITLIIAAIAALVAGIFLLVKNWDVVKETAANVWAGIVNVWNGVSEWFNATVVQPLCQFFAGLWNGIVNVWNGAAAWFSNLFTSAWNGICAAFSSIGSFFGSIWEGIKGIFSGVANWFGDTFSAAWNAVKNVFSAGGKIFDGIKDGISSVFKTVVNGLIGGINAVISVPFKAINKMLNKIRDVDVMGFTPFDGLWDKNPLTVPKIPMLAQGGYVRANQPQLAMIGDNRHQGEVVAPEDKLKQMAREVLAEGGGRGYDVEILLILKEILKALKELNIDIVIDGKKLKDIIVEKINQNTKQTGVCEILV